MAINTLSTITLNANGLNASIKRHSMAAWIKKQHPYSCSLQETLQMERHTLIENKVIKKDIS